MKPKNEMMKRLHDERKNAGFNKLSFWCHKDHKDEIMQKLGEILYSYEKNRNLPYVKMSN